MITLPISLTNEESKWLDDWSVMAGYKSPEEGIRELMKVSGAIPKGQAYWKDRFSFAE